MRHYNSVFHDLLKRVPWGEFDRLTKEHGADHRVCRAGRPRATRYAPSRISTGIRLSGLGAAWAQFSAKACGAKVHVIYIHDAGATYAFDLGYYDYGWWAKMDAASLPASSPTRL